MTVEHLLQAGLLLASIGLAIFCLTLARRLKKLNDLELGLGGAIAVMAAEVDRLEQAIRGARAEASDASERLSEEIKAARHERALWDLRQKIAEAALRPAESPEGAAETAPAARRLRKRQELADA